MFSNKVCVITGGANGIGKAIKEEFLKQNAKCYVIDICEGKHFVGDISKKETGCHIVVTAHELSCKLLDYLTNSLTLARFPTLSLK